MTAAYQQPPPQQAPPQPQVPLGTIAATQLALLVSSTLLTSTTVIGALEVLRPAFAARGLPWRALRGSLEVVMGMPPEAYGASGPATAAVMRVNHARRAQFVIASVQRLAADLAQARAQGQPLDQALLTGITRERRYYAQHLEAVRGRATAAAQADMAWLEYGPVLGWNAMMDSRTSAECRRAAGKNFLVAVMPSIGYPGMVHPHCRCWPGPPHPGARMLTGARMAAAA